MTERYFEETVASPKGDKTIDLAIGRVKAGGPNQSVFVEIDGRMFVLTEDAGRRLCAAFDELATYLSYD